MPTPDELRRNRRTAHRLGDWIDAVRHAPRRRRLLAGLAARGLAIAAGVTRSPERVSMLPATAPRRAPATPAPAHTLSESGLFVFCPGARDNVRASRYVADGPVFCGHCGALVQEGDADVRAAVEAMIGPTAAP